MKLFYSEPVDPCHFTIKCIPKNTARQELLEIEINMDPTAPFDYSTDGFGNEKIIGAVFAPHDHYFLKVTGSVEIKQLLYEEKEVPEHTGIFRYPYGKTVSGQGIIGFTNTLLVEMNERYIVKAYNKALYIMHKLYDYLKYDTHVTNVNTTAEEAFSKGGGVCQDYAHIFICILRRIGIPARYVTGLMIGEGQSHGWVEILASGKWIGLDPTNDLLVDDNYIKIGHGRDATDCKINLGIMHGGGKQTQEIEVKVWKE